MRNEADTKSAVLTDLVLTLFRVNNLTLTWGDRLVAPLGLTSARWQILGAIVFAERPQPVAWLARDLGASRQNVQRIVNDLEREGVVAFAPNPHHARAHLVILTAKGRQIYDEAYEIYAPLTEALGEGIAVDDLKTARRVLLALKVKLEGPLDDEKQV